MAEFIGLHGKSVDKAVDFIGEMVAEVNEDVEKLKLSVHDKSSSRYGSMESICNACHNVMKRASKIQDGRWSDAENVTVSEFNDLDAAIKCIRCPTGDLNVDAKKNQIVDAILKITMHWRIEELSCMQMTNLMLNSVDRGDTCIMSAEKIEEALEKKIHGSNQ